MIGPISASRAAISDSESAALSLAEPGVAFFAALDALFFGLAAADSSAFLLEVVLLTACFDGARRQRAAAANPAAILPAAISSIGSTSTISYQVSAALRLEDNPTTSILQLITWLVPINGVVLEFTKQYSR